MSIERYVELIPASGVIRRMTGNFMLLLTTTAAVNLRADRQGWSEGFDGVSGGVLIRRIKAWDEIQIIGTPGTSVEFFVGNEVVERDETDVRLQIATLSGISSFAEYPASSFVDNAPKVIATGVAAVQLFAANGSRRRISVHADSANPGSCYIRTGVATNNIGELQPGVVYNFVNFDELFVRNDTGGPCTFYICEEL